MSRWRPRTPVGCDCQAGQQGAGCHESRADRRARGRAAAERVRVGADSGWGRLFSPRAPRASRAEPRGHGERLLGTPLGGWGRGTSRRSCRPQPRRSAGKPQSRPRGGRIFPASCSPLKAGIEPGAMRTGCHRHKNKYKNKSSSFLADRPSVRVSHGTLPETPRYDTGTTRTRAPSPRRRASKPSIRSPSAVAVASSRSSSQTRE